MKPSPKPSPWQRPRAAAEVLGDVVHDQRFEPPRPDTGRCAAKAGIPVIVGTGAQNPQRAAEHAAHGRKVGAVGLTVISRVISRGTSAQRHHFAGVLRAAAGLPAVIYNRPYYGFETKAPLSF